MYTTIIDTETVASNLNNPGWRIIDCRFSLADTEKGRTAYGDSHLANALYAHLDDDLSSEIVPGQTGRHPLPTAEAAARVFSRWGIDRSIQVVAYDDNVGQVASRLWWMLRWLGHENVAVMDGGWEKWQKEGRSETADVPEFGVSDFPVEVKSSSITDVEHVNNVKENPEICLLDARAGARFRGEVEPIDPVAGHIPGARCAAFEENSGPDGLMKSPEALRDRFRVLIGGTETSHVICYCGSGVSACHNLLALVHAGLGEAKLYPGSWSEWITDPSRAIGTGE
ncbi:MAG: sulfurtransferase [Candidatus Latescibacteria bacterium]|nr:sulfurtransferase [Candidatus Latescibacterota bacterium]